MFSSFQTDGGGGGTKRLATLEQNTNPFGIFIL
jgi:hypothetical protein